MDVPLVIELRERGDQDISNVGQGKLHAVRERVEGQSHLLQKMGFR